MMDWRKMVRDCIKQSGIDVLRTPIRDTFDICRTVLDVVQTDLQDKELYMLIKGIVEPQVWRREEAGLYPRPALIIKETGRPFIVRDDHSRESGYDFSMEVSGPVTVIVRRVRKKYQTPRIESLRGEAVEYNAKQEAYFKEHGWGEAKKFFPWQMRDSESSTWVRQRDGSRGRGRYYIIPDYETTIIIPAVAGVFVSTHSHHPTEEGYHTSHKEYSYNPDTCLFELEQEDNGSDCDGRTDWYGDYTCVGGRSYWETVSRSQRDHSAEAMGY